MSVLAKGLRFLNPAFRFVKITNSSSFPASSVYYNSSFPTRVKMPPKRAHTAEPEKQVTKKVASKSKKVENAKKTAAEKPEKKTKKKNDEVEKPQSDEAPNKVTQRKKNNVQEEEKVEAAEPEQAPKKPVKRNKKKDEQDEAETGKSPHKKAKKNEEQEENETKAAPSKKVKKNEAKEKAETKVVKPPKKAQAVKEDEEKEESPEPLENGTKKVLKTYSRKKKDDKKSEETEPQKEEKKDSKPQKKQKVVSSKKKKDETQDDPVETKKDKKPKSTKPAKEPKEDTKEPAKPKSNQVETEWESIDFKCSKKNAEGNKSNLKITSWNIAGLRAWLNKGCLELLHHDTPDIFCVQETKCGDDKIPEMNLENYKAYWCSSRAYAGVGLLTKIEPISVKFGIDDKEQDEDGRCITAEFEKYYLVNVYVPNAGRKLVTLDKRLRWNELFLNFIKDLDKKKPVIICGDMNVAHNEIDLKNPKTNTKNAGFTQEERDGMTTFLQEGFIDTFRHLYPDKQDVYTFWTFMMNCRKKNVGWRLDYFIVSNRIKDKICDHVVYDQVFGSDHCPISLFINI